MNAHPQFVKRLASEYFRRYKDVGPVDAKKFADRTIRGDKELEQAVKNEVAIIIRRTLRGK